MMHRFYALLMQQSTLSAIVLGAILAFTAHNSNLSFSDILDSATGLAGKIALLLGAVAPIALALKAYLPDPSPEQREQAKEDVRQVIHEEVGDGK